MNKKTVLILLGTFGVLFLLCICCLVISFFGFSNIMKPGFEITQNELVNLCEDSRTLSQGEMFFTEEFMTRNTYEETLESLEIIFPESQDCSKLASENFIEMIQNRQAISITTTNGSTVITVIFDNSEGDSFTFKYVEEDNMWKINQIFRGRID